MIDIKKYNLQKAQGLTTLRRITNESFALASKKFNPEDGSELPEDVLGFKLSEVKTGQEKLQTQIDEISAFIEELEGLEPENE